MFENCSQFIKLFEMHQSERDKNKCMHARHRDVRLERDGQMESGWAEQAMRTRSMQSLVPVLLLLLELPDSDFQRIQLSRKLILLFRSCDLRI